MAGCLDSRSRSTKILLHLRTQGMESHRSHVRRLCSRYPPCCSGFRNISWHFGHDMCLRVLPQSTQTRQDIFLLSSGVMPHPVHWPFRSSLPLQDGAIWKKDRFALLISSSFLCESLVAFRASHFDELAVAVRTIYYGFCFFEWSVSFGVPWIPLRDHQLTDIRKT
jgi:hypothetical protein